MDTTVAEPPALSKTTLGTPVSPKWDADWLAEVERVETELGRRICGAHTPAWTPCKLASTHLNGRCRFHGGHPGIGAPDGNRNAWVHGLYSRRLQQCGDHCPLWNHCPMAGKDVLALHPSERPHCVYEQEEFNAITSMLRTPSPADSPNLVIARSEVATKQSLPDAIAQAESHAPKPAAPTTEGLIEHNVALFQVMLSRAQAALGIAHLTDDTQAYALTSNYRMRSTKVGALAQAQLHIARELRQWLKLLPQFDSWRGHPARGSSKSPADTPPANPQPTGLPMRMMRVLQETEGALEAALGLPPGEKSAFSPRLPNYMREVYLFIAPNTRSACCRCRSSCATRIANVSRRLYVMNDATGDVMMV